MNPSNWKIADQIKYQYILLQLGADEDMYDLTLGQVRERYALARKLKEIKEQSE